MILYFWLLFPPPIDLPICALWVSAPPTTQQMLAACGVELFTEPEYIMQAEHLYTGQVDCTRPATELPAINCTLFPLDHYRLVIYRPDYQPLACTLRLNRQGPPNEADISSQCPLAPDGYSLRYSGVTKPPAPVQACTLPAVDNSAPLATSAEYQFLAGRLAWWGITAITPLEWQNRFDEQIRGAADAARIPARLLKAMLAVESQFWPLWTGDAGEVGWLQVTWDGADTALRHSEQLFDKYCSQALAASWCTRGYDLLPGNRQRDIQAVLLADLHVSGTPLQAADMAAADLWVSALILRSYACLARDLSPDADPWQTAAVLYNAGPSCIANGVTCPQGQAYWEKVK